MRNAIAVLAAVLSVAAYAQMAPSVQRSSSPAGVQIQGDTAVNANAQNVGAVSAGEGNSAKTATGTMKAGTQIQGNTRINANAMNVNSIAVGKGNTAGSDVGSIGGK